MKIDCAFPGGNIVVERLEENAAWLHQDLRDTEGDWFYWCFRVTGAGGKEIRFHFTRSVAIGARGPAVSLDRGETWNWLGIESVVENTFFFQFPPGADEIFFSMTIPYTSKDWDAWVKQIGASPYVEQGTLCVSRQGRSVERLRVGCLHGSPEHWVLLVARHHCCETICSFALEGLISFIINDANEGEWLRHHVEFLAVPFMDKDGVEDGDQGKRRRPHDHNRDYNETSIYAETSALRSLIASWSAGRLHVALDLHCPWLKWANNEMLYLVGEKDPRIWKEQQRYSNILERVRTGPLPYLAADNMPFDTDWNTEASFAEGMSFTRWISGREELVLVSAIELPYANARGVELNATSARQFGADLGRAIAVYLRKAE